MVMEKIGIVGLDKSIEFQETRLSGQGSPKLAKMPLRKIRTSKIPQEGFPRDEIEKDNTGN